MIVDTMTAGAVGSRMTRAADLILYAFTLSCDTVPGILKNFMERVFCLEQPYMIAGVRKTRHPRRVIKNQSLFVFSVCGFLEFSHFDPVNFPVEGMAHPGAGRQPFVANSYLSRARGSISCHRCENVDSRVIDW
jgi:hypothetical protein